jgi:hypothetical protein
MALRGSDGIKKRRPSGRRVAHLIFSGGGKMFSFRY